MGYGQTMPATAEDLGITDPLDPSQSIFGAARQLSWLFSKYGSWDEALMAYNWGEKHVDDFKDDPTRYLPDETRQYPHQVKAIVKLLDRLNPEGRNVPPKPADDSFANGSRHPNPSAFALAHMPGEEAKFRHQQAVADNSRPFYLAQNKTY